MSIDSGERPAIVGRQLLWERYCAYRCEARGTGVSLDISRVAFDDGYLARMAPSIASAMDCRTQHRDPKAHPAALLAHMWFWLGRGRGEKNMVVLPYRDCLALFGRYVRQLVMESIGKERDRSGATVHQGLTVYGHKGSTDQHAYGQQLRDGPDDFFVTFVGVARDRASADVEIEPGLTLGDYLSASLEGTRNALYDRGRQSLTITLSDAAPRSLGALVALFERATGLYAELIDVNAYHQPGVDKQAAAALVRLQKAVLTHLERLRAPQTAEEIAGGIGQPEEVESVYKLLDRLAQDPRRGVVVASGPMPFSARFTRSSPVRSGATPHQQAAAPPASGLLGSHG